MLLLKNANVITLDENMPHADYMLIEDGRIIHLGAGNPDEAAGKIAAGGSYEVIDLKGHTIIPGFWESHLHIIDGTRSLMELNLRDCTSIVSLKKRIDIYRASIAPGEWIIGHGWNETLLFSGKFPDRHLLDSLCDSNPMVLIRMDGHSVCINSKAMDAVDTDWMNTEDEIPFGNDGLPAGMLYENAASRILEIVSNSLSDSYIETIVLKAQQLFIENGITSVNDICTGRGRCFDIYNKLQRENKLKLRITASPKGLDKNSIAEFEKRKQHQTSRLKVGPPKFFIDGSFGSRTALLFKGYADEPDNTGLKLISDDELITVIASNAEIKQPINIHAIGDYAVASVLDAYENTGVDFIYEDIRGRIEHIQIIREKDIDRFKQFNIAASFQPVFLFEKELTNNRVGNDRLKEVYRFNSLIESGANVIFNSDWPYGGDSFPQKPDSTGYIGFEPLLGMYSACCNQFNSSEAVSPLIALKCYTTNPAYANYMEQELGRLQNGFLADFVVLSHNPLNCKQEEIKEIEVLMTVINGEIVYNKLD